MHRCASCDHSCRFVQPTGNLTAEVMLIGEKPGKEEANRGLVFQGDSGRELNSLYLPMAGLDREDVYITNTVKCRLGDSNDKPTSEQVKNCSTFHLPEEIEQCGPKHIILLGSTACSLVPKIELDKDHGIPLFIEPGEIEAFGDWSGWVMASYHPAAALHDTGMMIPLMDDFNRFRKWRAGKYKLPKAGEYGTDYKVATAEDVVSDFEQTRHNGSIAVDTEDDGPDLWSVQYSLKPGMGRLVRVGDKEAIHELQHCLKDRVVIFHHAGHDLDALGKLKIVIPHFRDTMQEAYQLGNQPQGLKALAWRLCGIRMQSWEDVVLPPSREKMIGWLMEQWGEWEEKRVRVEHPYKKTRKNKITGELIYSRVEWKPTETERVVKRILSHSYKPEYDLWDKVVEVDGLSGWPIKSIAHVPIDEAVFYGCQDADVTGQVAGKLEKLRGEIVKGEWKVGEEDWDK